MSNDIFLEPGGSRRHTGLWVAVLIVVAVAIGGVWYIATQLRLAKHARTAKPVVVQVEPVKTEVASPAPAVPPPVAPPAQTALMAKVEEPVSAVVPSTPPAAPPPVVPVTQVAAPVADASVRLAEARELFKNDRCLQACDSCNQVLDKNTNMAVRAQAEALLGEIHVTLAFSRRPMPEKTDYTVQVGDTLAGLAKKFTTTKELIRRSNNFSGDVIRLGDRFRVLGAKWAVTVNKNNNDLLVTMNDKFFKRYRVGTGQYSMTPTGTFHIVSRLEHPTWYRAGGAPVPYGDTNNVLGTHWISLDIPHYGIHGTWETNTIGQQSSQGCIRLLNSQVEELYILLPEGTPVTITE
ncbi:MAG: L,D-transpeptidase [Verrucomicrobia bacterium]|nr:MAG: L,D-transpeptidase [Verrucomicrobiota bacterium]